MEADTERAKRALGLGLCDTKNVLDPEQRQGLDRDLAALHAARTAIISNIDEVVH